MLNNEAQAASLTNLLAPASRSAGANTGAWVKVTDYEGDLNFLCSTGAITGSIAYKVQDATDNTGTGAADVSGATLAGVADTPGHIVVKSHSVRAYVTIVATVTTGPVLCAAALQSRPKNIS